MDAAAEPTPLVAAAPDPVPSPATRRVTVADGVTLHVLDWTLPGAGGQPFVLVHGLASNARLWDGVAARLAAQGHPVVAVDQRGHGRSDTPDDGYDFTTVTDDLRTLVAALGFDRPVVAGQSWGGNVVVELAARFPTLTAGIVCVDGGTIELGEQFTSWEACEHALTPPRLAGMAATRIEAAIRLAHPDWPDAGIAGTMANFEVLADGTVRPWLSLERHLQILRALYEHRPSDRFPAITVPVLLVPAGLDARRAHAIERAAALLPVSRTHWFPDADHDVHAQHPTEVAALFHACCQEGFFSP